MPFRNLDRESPDKNLLQRRPAETLGVAGAIAYVILYALDQLDDKLLLASLAVIIGSIPAAVTAIVHLVWVLKGRPERRFRERWSHLNGDDH